MKASAIDQDLSADMTIAECSTDEECAVLFRFDMLCTEKVLHRIVNALHGWGMEPRLMIFQVYSTQNKARLVFDDARSVGVSFRHSRCGDPEDWHRDSLSTRKTEQVGSYHDVAQVGNIPGHQNGSEKRQASPECSEGEIGRRNRRGCFHGRIQRCFPKVLASWCCVKKSHRASDCRKKQGVIDSGKWRGSRKGDNNVESNKEKFNGECYK